MSSAKSRNGSETSSSGPSPEVVQLVGQVRGLRDGLGYVELPDQENISLGKWDMRRVFPGDIVKVSPGRVGRGGRLHGRIVKVLERKTTRVTGRFHSESGLDFVRPSNTRIAQDIHVGKKHSGGASDGQIVVVEILQQPGNHAPAHGRVAEILGDELNAGMEIEIALREFAIPHQWPEAAQNEADRLGSSVRARHKRHRLDLRGTPFVTIDGEDARDFDDAVFAEKRADGWRLWVAIADVSHYVKPGSALDREAETRGTSVYFPEYVVPMLPEVLSNGLCSLKPNVDRLALVCDIQVDSRGRVREFQFAEAVIRSHQRLTYSQVARLLDEQDPDSAAERHRLGSLAEHIDELHRLHSVLLEARQKRGAMEFESVEVRFEFNENRKIERIVPVKRNDAHRVIEECMLCANICAARFLAVNRIPGLYRVHLPPANEKLAALRDSLAELGLWLGGGDQPSTADFLKLNQAIEDREDRHLIQTMILRSQQQALYQPENRGHFGLAYDAYAHFTSPIRRYPDLLVHRAIRAGIRSADASVGHVHRVRGATSQKPHGNYPYDLEQLQALGQQCSVTERRAEEATRDVTQWLKCEFLQKHLGDCFPGVVSAVTHFGLFVEISGLYIEGLIHVTSLPKDFYDYNPATHQLVGQTTRRTFTMGDQAGVQVARVDLDERRIDLVFADEPAGRRVAGDQPDSPDQRRVSRALTNRKGGAQKTAPGRSKGQSGARKSKKTRSGPGTRNRRGR